MAQWYRSLAPSWSLHSEWKRERPRGLEKLFRTLDGMLLGGVCDAVFRRPGAVRTNLHELGVAAILILTIFRREDASASQRSYVRNARKSQSPPGNGLRVKLPAQQQSSPGLVN